jgi:hypothetical protein
MKSDGIGRGVPSAAVKHPASGQAIKPMPTLCVASGFGCDCASGSSVHGIFIIFMYLHILAKFFMNVFVVVNFHSSNQFPGIDIPGDNIFWWDDV